MQKVEFSQQSWDKKKILLTVLVLAGLIIAGLGLKNYLLDSNGSNLNSTPNTPNTQSSVKGSNISSTPTPTITLPSAQSIGQEALGSINNIKQEINKLNVQELATSSPQIQKIVNDIKGLPNVPGQQAKDICLKVCNGL